MFSRMSDDAQLRAIRSSAAYARSQWGARTVIAAVVMGGVAAVLVPMPIPHIFAAICGVVAFVGFLAGFAAMLSAVVPVNRLTIPFVYGDDKQPDSHRMYLLMKMIISDIVRAPGKPLPRD
jgi:hypothetical protein